MSPFKPVSIASLPETPGTVQKVKYFTARSTYIAESSIEQLSAIEFDAFIMQLFSDIPDIDRLKWEPSDRLFALNSALDQTAERQAEGFPSIRLDEVQKGVFQISLIEPAEPEPAVEPAIESAIQPASESTSQATVEQEPRV